MKKLVAPFFLFLFSFCTAQAQCVVWDRKSDALSDTKRLIVLQLDSTDLPDVKKLKKNTDLVKAYSRYTRVFNDMIKQPVQSHWTLCKQIDFMTVKDFIAFRKKAGAQDKKQTLVLLFESPEYQFMNALENEEPAALAHIEFEKVKTGSDFTQPVSLFNLENVRPFDDNEIATGATTALARLEFSRWYLTASDIVFALEQMQEALRANAQQRNEFIFYLNFNPSNKGKLAGKTLLIPEEYTIKAGNGKKTIQDADLKKLYSWPWKFASNKEIDDAVAKKDPNFAVLVSTTHEIANALGGTYFWAMDTGGSILGYSTPGNKNLGVGTVMKEKDLYDLNERRVKEIVENGN
ncbi:MAG: hypothetical protein JNM22_03325 [Saprospiraceae bacterium]|nr:hypothetical protein [Saprospiraceae bacterium]